MLPLQLHPQMVRLSSLLRIRTINRSLVSQISSMFISSLWDVKKPTHYSRRVGNEVPGVVAVLRECMHGYSRSTAAE